METTKELSVINAAATKAQLTFDEVMKYSEVFSKSGMFEDAKDAAKAFVKINIRPNPHLKHSLQLSQVYHLDNP